MTRQYPTLQDVRLFWNQRPCNVRHSTIDIDVDPLGYHREVAVRKYMVEPHITSFSQFDKWQGKRVLEAGCGIGTMAISFARAGAHVVAVDLSEQSIEIAKKRVDALDLAGDIRFVVTPLEELHRRLPGEPPFDLIYSFGVIHHTPYPQTALHNFRHFVHEHSQVKLMLYHKVSWKVLWILFKHGGWLKLLGSPLTLTNLNRIVGEHSEAQTGCPVTHTYTRRQARKMLEECGFLVNNMGIDHIFPYQVEPYIQGQHVKEWYWQRLPPWMFRWLERHFGWHLLIDAVADPDAVPVGFMERAPLRIG